MLSLVIGAIKRVILRPAYNKGALIEKGFLGQFKFTELLFHNKPSSSNLYTYHIQFMCLLLSRNWYEVVLLSTCNLPEVMLDSTLPLTIVRRMSVQCCISVQAKLISHEIIG